MEWKNLPLSPEARECLIAEMEAKFQALSPTASEPFCGPWSTWTGWRRWQRRQMENRPPQTYEGVGWRRVIGWRPGGLSGEEGIFPLYQNHPTSLGQRLEGGQVPLQNAGGCDVDLFLVCDVQEGGVV